MIRPAKSLEGAEVRARDGVVGNVKDLYFDDEQWHVRYLVVSTDGWLGRPVLIATAAVLQPVANDGFLDVVLTQEQVRNSPETDAAKPISRQHEEELHRYYAWPYYWRGPYIGGGMDAPIAAPAAPTAVAVHAARNPRGGRGGEIRDPQAIDTPPVPESHVRSALAVRGYHIEAADGAVGHLEDLLVDDVNWAVRHLIVDTRNWLPGRKVVVPRDQVREFSWLNSSVFVHVGREAIKNGPEFDPSRPLPPDYTDRLEAHYRTSRTP